MDEAGIRGQIAVIILAAWEAGRLQVDALPNEMADRILSLETHGYTLEQMIEFFSKINRETEREAVVRREAKLPKFEQLYPYSVSWGKTEELRAKAQHGLAQYQILSHNFVQEVKVAECGFTPKSGYPHARQFR